MENSKQQLRANIYNQHFRQPHKKKSIETSQTINDSLPFLQPLPTHQKHNVINKQLNETKTQIMLMEAKLTNLRKLKQKFEEKKDKNITKLQFMNNVKDRVQHDSLRKQKIREQRQQSERLLKLQAESLRQSLVTQRKNAQNSLLETKMQEAEQERRRHKQQQYLIQKLKEMEQLQNSKRVEKIKDLHSGTSSRLKSFQQSRINFSKDNYHKKVLTAMKERELASSRLKQMKDQEKQLIEEVRNSQQSMLTSLYSLDVHNPQKRRARFSSSQAKLHVNQGQGYQNEQFQQ